MVPSDDAAVVGDPADCAVTRFSRSIDFADIQLITATTDRSVVLSRIRGVAAIEIAAKAADRHQQLPVC